MELNGESRANVIKELKQLQNQWDFEETHEKADRIMTHLLRHLGYDDIVDEYDKVGKYYA